MNGPTAATEVGREKLRQAARYERWAREADVSLSIQVHEGASTVIGERYRELRVPTMTLAEFREIDLRCVTPHTNGETTRTDTDRLCALEREANPGQPNSVTDAHEPIERVVRVVGGVNE